MDLFSLFLLFILILGVLVIRELHRRRTWRIEMITALEETRRWMNSGRPPQEKRGLVYANMAKISALLRVQRMRMARCLVLTHGIEVLLDMEDHLDCYSHDQVMEQRKLVRENMDLLMEVLS